MKPSERLRGMPRGVAEDTVGEILDELWLAVFPKREEAPAVSEARDWFGKNCSKWNEVADIEAELSDDVSEVRGGGDAVETATRLRAAIMSGPEILAQLDTRIMLDRIIAAIEAEREFFRLKGLRMLDDLEASLAAEKRAHGDTKDQWQASDETRRETISDLQSKLAASESELLAQTERASEAEGELADSWTRADRDQFFADRGEQVERFILETAALKDQLRAQSSDGLRAAVVDLVRHYEEGSRRNQISHCSGIVDALNDVLAAHPSPSEAVESAGLDVALPHRESHPVVRKSDLTELQSRVEAAAQVLRRERQRGDTPCFTMTGDTLEALGFDRDGNEVGNGKT